MKKDKLDVERHKKQSQVSMKTSVIQHIVVVLLFAVLTNSFSVINNIELLSRQARNFTVAQRDFQRQVLSAHNTYRSRHCARPLRLDDRLSRSAQNYAQRLATINTMVHSGIKGLGENLYMIMSSSKITRVDGR
jgi:uncharacterized protein YkwD